jgi:hypothetical protein
MILIERFDVTDTVLTDTNLPENDAPEWNIATTYAANAEVIVVEFHRVYVSAINGNVGNKPSPGGDANWILKGATNRWAAFDEFVANPAENEDLIEYEFTVTSTVTSIAFFGLDADEISITIELDENTITYTEELLSLSHINGSMWNWLTGGRPRLPEYAFTGLAYFGTGTKITVQIRRPDGIAKVGQIVLGKSQEIGMLETMVEISKDDFNRYQEDEFGNIQITRRLPAKITAMNVFRRTANVRFVEEVLDRASGRFTAFIGSEESEAGLILFGFVRNSRILIETKEFHRVRMEVRSLI